MNTITSPHTTPDAPIPNQIAGVSSGTYYLRAIKSNTKTATNPTQACVAALTGTQTVNLGYQCNNPATCYAANLMSINGGTATTVARNNNGSTSSYLPVNMTFDSNGNAGFTFIYSDVGKVTLLASDTVGSVSLTGSSNAFITKPGGFVLSGIQQTASPNLVNPVAVNATGGKFVKAGEAFSVTVTATTTGGTTTPSFGNEASPESVKLTSALVPGLGLTDNPTLVNNTAFGTFTNGVATGTTFNWNEVGIITLAPSISSGNYLGAGGDVGTTGSITTGNNVLTVASASGILVNSNLTIIGAGAGGGNLATTVTALNGTSITLANSASSTVTGANVYLSSSNIGRFYAAQFALSGGVITNRTDICGVAGCGGFTYMGEQMSAGFTLTAQAVGGATLQNYVDTFAKLDPTVAGNLNFGAIDIPGAPAARTPLAATRISTTGLPATTGQFISTCSPTPACLGTAVVTAPFMITRGVNADGPYANLNIGIAPQDADGASIAASYDLDTTNVVSTTFDHKNIGSTTTPITTAARYGRIKISNASGSQLLQLPISLTAQYWSNGNYITNTDDSKTVLQTTDNTQANYIQLSNFQCTSGGTLATILSLPSTCNGNPITGTACYGIWPSILSKPNSTCTGRGSVDISILAQTAANCLNTPAKLGCYLPSTTGRATFGVYTGNRNFIYMRENY